MMSNIVKIITDARRIAYAPSIKKIKDWFLELYIYIKIPFSYHLYSKKTSFSTNIQKIDDNLRVFDGISVDKNFCMPYNILL